MKLSRREALKAMGLASLTVISQSHVNAANISKKPKRPNILWISCEDISPNLGCYGDPHAITPTLDKLAEQGTRYTNAFTPAGVCAPCRSAIITGVNQSSLGTRDMRCKALLPEKIKLFPEYLRNAGYYCTNNSKQDYQILKTPEGTWDESSKKAHWRNGPKDQPFFAVFNINICHESKIKSVDEEKHLKNIPSLTKAQRQNPDEMQLPPYYPNTPATRIIWAHYLEVITQMDYQAAGILKQLKDDGLEEDTIVIYWSDHGAGMQRAKRWVYDSGTRVPMIARIPEKYRVANQGKPGSVCDDLICLIDLGPTVMNLAGLDTPEYMQAQPFLGPNLPKPRAYVHAARDRIDERYDMVRSICDKRYRYLKNYLPEKAYDQHVNYNEQGTIMKELRRLQAEGKLSPIAAQFMASSRPLEELYDIQEDRYETKNLATEPQFEKILQRLRKAHQKHFFAILDTGLIPELELLRLEQILGNRYDILRQPGGKKLLKRLYKMHSMAVSAQPKNFTKLSKALKDENASIRYWSVIGLGNIASKATQAAPLLIEATKDTSPAVRIKAAGALCKMNREKEGLPILINEVTKTDGLVRLLAGEELDSMGEKARPAIEALKKAVTIAGYNNAKKVARHALRALQPEK
ncbi:MAG: sulfatase-like hydrolase/transferase [Planctomycetes bacterium]|nr:sulfatase-like hydrolase/transferase [Planctomycetota bacterium]